MILITIKNDYKWLFQRRIDQPCESSSPSGAKTCKALEEPRHFQLLSSLLNIDLDNNDYAADGEGDDNGDDNGEVAFFTPEH